MKNVEMSVTKKIIIIVSYLFTWRDYHRFGAEYFEKRGWDITIWVINSMNTPNDSTISLYKKDNCIQLNYVDFRKKVNANSNDTVYLYYPERLIDRYGRYLLKKRKKVISMRGMGSIPIYPLINEELLGSTKTISHRCLTQRISSGVIREIHGSIHKISRVFQEKRNELLLARNPITIITSTHYYSDKQIWGADAMQHIINVHAMNYDCIVELERAGEISREDHILFVDSGLVEHDTDTVLFGGTGCRADIRKDYYHRLLELFDKLEGYYHVPVIISGHPHVMYAPDAFEGREIIFGRTPELVLHSKLVVLQQSTSINFAVYFNKPVLIVNDDCMKSITDSGYNFDKVIRTMALTYGTSYISLNDYKDEEWKLVRPFRQEVREQVIKDLLIDNETNSITIPEIIEKAILEMPDKKLG